MSIYADILSFGIAVYLLISNFPITDKTAIYNNEGSNLVLKEVNHFSSMIWKINTVDNNAIVPFSTASKCQYSDDFAFCSELDSFNSHTRNNN